MKILEDFPFLNAGKGSVFTIDGTIEMDAGIMDGESGNAGGVTNIKNLKNPIQAAHLVMEETTHILLVGSGAEEFALKKGLKRLDNSYQELFEEFRWLQLQSYKRTGASNPLSPQLDHDVDAGTVGTVGAVALDQYGHLAAGSSTGGLTGKLPGRVSDSAIVGAGFYANKNLGVSMTGQGDAMILHSSAKQLAINYEKRPDLMNVATELIGGLSSPAGLIAVDSNGNIAMPYNTPGMIRGSVAGTTIMTFEEDVKNLKVSIYQD